MNDELSNAGPVLHRVTRANIVRPSIQVLGGLFLFACVAFFLATLPFDLNTLLFVLFFLFGVGWLMGIPVAIRWFSAYVASVHEHGIIIARRRARIFVPWRSITGVERRLENVNGATFVNYVVHGGPYPAPIAPATIGAELADAILTEIIRRADLVWDEGASAWRA